MSCLLLKYKMLKLAHVMYVNLGSPVFHSILQSFFLPSASCGVLDNVCETHSVPG